MSDVLAIVGSAMGLFLPGLALAVAWGRLQARFDAQDTTLGRLERKLDELAKENIRDLELQMTALGEKVHAARNYLQLVADRLDSVEKSARLDA